MGKRPTLTLKARRASAIDADIAGLLDQCSDLDPHNPHKLVQPSQAVIPDYRDASEVGGR